MKTYKLANLLITDEAIRNLIAENPELKEEGGKLLNNGEYYWYISDEANIICEEWRTIDKDLFRYYQGNCFKTEEETEKALEIKQAENRVRKYIWDNDYEIENVDWSDDQEKWCIYYDASTGELKLISVYNHNYRTIFENIISEVACKDIIEHCKEDLELIFK